MNPKLRAVRDSRMENSPTFTHVVIHVATGCHIPRSAFALPQPVQKHRRHYQFVSIDWKKEIPRQRKWGALSDDPLILESASCMSYMALLPCISSAKFSMSAFLAIIFIFIFIMGSGL